MGIEGLQSYTHEKSGFSSHVNLTQEAQKSSTPLKLLVDGDSLYHRLYFMTQMDWVHGGQHKQYPF